MAGWYTHGVLLPLLALAALSAPATSPVALPAGPSIASPGGTTWYVDASNPGLGTGTPADPFRSVAYAVSFQGVQSGDELLVAPGDYLNETIDFDGKNLVVRSTEGSEATRLFAPPQTNQAEPWVVARINSGETDVVLEGFRITGGTGDRECTAFTSVVGGAVVVCGSQARFVDCQFAANRAQRGGSIYAQDATLELVRCAFRGPGSEALGEGVFTLRSNVSVTGCIFEELFLTQPTLPMGGGALVAVESTLEVVGTRFERNATRFFGGHLWARTSDVTVRDCFFGQVTGYAGAAIAVSDGSLQISGSTIRGARATGSPGAGLYATDADLRIDDCTFEDNVVTGVREGGALALQGGTVLIQASRFLRNRAGAGGGAIHAQNCALDVSRSIFVGNTSGPSSRGGAAWGPGRYDRCSFHLNVAGLEGGAGGAGATLSRSIAYRNLPADLDGTCRATRSLVGNPGLALTRDVIQADPYFWAPDDLHLLPGSPAIDALAGDPQLPLDGDGSAAELGALRFDARYCGLGCQSTVGTQGCASTRNSTGTRATLVGLGRTAVLDNRLLVLGSSLPPLAPALLLGAQSGASIHLTGSAGRLCVASPVLRFQRTLQAARPDGSAPAWIPLNGMPAGAVATAGDTWHFQIWYRDLAAAQPTNTTDSVVVTLD